MFERKHETLIYLLLSLAAQLSIGVAISFQSRVAAFWHNGMFVGYILYPNGIGWALLSVGVTALYVIALTMLKNRPRLTTSQSRIVVLLMMIPLTDVCLNILENGGLVFRVQPFESHFLVLELVVTITVTVLIAEHKFGQIPLITRSSAWLRENLPRSAMSMSPLRFAAVNTLLITAVVFSASARHPLANFIYSANYVWWYAFLAWLLYANLFDTNLPSDNELASQAHQNKSLVIWLLLSFMVVISLWFQHHRLPSITYLTIVTTASGTALLIIRGDEKYDR
mgnify:CR=1 FL=1